MLFKSTQVGDLMFAHARVNEQCTANLSLSSPSHQFSNPNGEKPHHHELSSKMSVVMVFVRRFSLFLSVTRFAFCTGPQRRVNFVSARHRQEKTAQVIAEFWPHGGQFHRRTYTYKCVRKHRNSLYSHTLIIRWDNDRPIRRIVGLRK